MELKEAEGARKREDRKSGRRNEKRKEGAHKTAGGLREEREIERCVFVCVREKDEKGEK